MSQNGPTRHQHTKWECKEGYVKWVINTCPCYTLRQWDITKIWYKSFHTAGITDDYSCLLVPHNVIPKLKSTPCEYVHVSVIRPLNYIQSFIPKWDIIGNWLWMHEVVSTVIFDHVGNGKNSKTTMCVASCLYETVFIFIIITLYVNIGYSKNHMFLNKSLLMNMFSMFATKHHALWFQCMCS